MRVKGQKLSGSYRGTVRQRKLLYYIRITNRANGQRVHSEVGQAPVPRLRVTSRTRAGGRQLIVRGAGCTRCTVRLQLAGAPDGKRTLQIRRRRGTFRIVLDESLLDSRRYRLTVRDLGRGATVLSRWHPLPAAG